MRFMDAFVKYVDRIYVTALRDYKADVERKSKYARDNIRVCTVAGKVFLIEEYGARDGECWEIYVPLAKTGEIEPTMAALRDYLNG